MILTADRISNVEEYYFSKKLAEVRSLDSPQLRVINLGIGSPDQPPSPNVINALTTAAQNRANHGYQSYKGIPAFRKAIAEFCQAQYGVRLDPETMILPLIGSKEGILHISMAFVNPGEVVLLPDPGYPTYSSVAKLVGANVRTYDLREENGWKVDVEALRRSDLSKVKLMWINYPHMPTGVNATPEELRALVSLAREKNFLIVNDNPYSMILNDTPSSLLSVDGADDVALELNSLSKSHNMAGWRLGWVAGRGEYIEAVLKVKSNMDSGMFLGLQHAAIEALKNSDEWFRLLNEMYSGRKRLAIQILEVLECEYHDNRSGLFVWAKAPQNITDVNQWIDEILYEAKVFITPGFIFGENGKRFIRISLCCSEETLTEALGRLKSFQRTRKKGDTVTRIDRS